MAVRVRVADAWYTYPGRPAPALRGACLEAGPNTPVGLVGPNGSGKTTLLMVAAGLLVPDRGTAHVIDLETREPIPARRARGRIVYHPPEPVILEGTVLENIAAGPLLRGVEDDALRRAEEAAGLLGISGLLDRRAKSLSRGQAMLTSIARLLAAGPEALLLDEPSASLDLGSRERLALALRGLARRGLTVVVASHDLLFLDRLGSRIVEIIDGETPEECRRL